VNGAEIFILTVAQSYQAFLECLIHIGIFRVCDVVEGIFIVALFSDGHFCSA
jgi:hypothetical protein